jgi:hypothetical protein
MPARSSPMLIANAAWRVPTSWRRPRTKRSKNLTVLDDAAFGGATPVVPKFVCSTDPAARWTAASGGFAVYAYSDNYVIDLKHAVIMDVEATTAVRITARAVSSLGGNRTLARSPVRRGPVSCKGSR